MGEFFNLQKAMKMYSIGDVSKMFELSIPTLRYYDQQGLFPGLKRTKSGIRRFGPREIDSIRIIEYLKKAGMSLKDIRLFIDWCNTGDSTLARRRDMFMEKRKAVQAQIDELNRVQDLLTYKCWYCTQAVKDNTEEHVKKIQSRDMPEDIQKAYANSHTDLQHNCQ